MDLVIVMKNNGTYSRVRSSCKLNLLCGINRHDRVAAWAAVENVSHLSLALTQESAAGSVHHEPCPSRSSSLRRNAF